MTDVTYRGAARVHYPTSDPYLLRGLFACSMCLRGLVPVRDPKDGARFYSCGPPCPQPNVPAEPAESDLLLAALIRAAAVTLPAERESQGEDEHAGPVGRLVRRMGTTAHGPVVSAEELQRWRECEPTDRWAMLNVAYLAVYVNEAGQVRPLWRHHAERMGAPV